MGSNGFTAFLTKLLRPEKPQRTAKNRDNLKRHSAPVPDWFDVNDVIQQEQAPAPVQTNNGKEGKENQKLKNKKAKKKQPVKKSKSDAQALQKSNIKREKKSNSAENLNRINEVINNSSTETSKTRNNNKESKNRKPKNSNGLAYWFCMSHNVDSLQRGMAPFPNDKAKVNDKKLQEIKENSDTVPPLAGVIRRDKKQKKKDSKYRYSAPAADNLAIFIPKDDSNQRDGRLDVDTRRRLSPGVRYRVDGTLERPYVFPSGLTFGPDGRKVCLRSSSPNKLKDKGKNKDVKVEAVIHESTKEESDLSYEYEVVKDKDGCLNDERYDEFDARKAFFLKYDENSQPYGKGDSYRYSMPNFPASYDVFENIDIQALEGGFIPGIDVFSKQGREGGADLAVGNPERVSRRSKKHSVPVNNSDECIYMGSCENLNVWDFENEYNQADQVGLNPDKHRHSKRECRSTQKRYSMPVVNSDFVYQGSLENIHLLNAEDKRAGVLSLRRDLDPSCLDDDNLENVSTSYLNGHPVIQTFTGNRYEIREPLNTFGLSQDDEHKYQYEFKENYCVQPFCQDGTKTTLASNIENPAADTDLIQDNEMENVDTLKTVLNNQHKYFELHRHSMPELQIGELKLPRVALSEGNESDKDGEPLHFTPSFERSPFSRNLGRSSCMPGNKRSVAPPPAIFDPPNENDIEKETAPKRSSPVFPGGVRRFKIPPPPTYTPPREEMEDALLMMSKHSCSRGSQTDLAADCDDPDLNMEDRDMSLKRSDAKELLSAISQLGSQSPQKSQPASNSMTAISPSKDTSLVSTSFHTPKFYISSEASNGKSKGSSNTENTYFNFNCQSYKEASKLNVSTVSQGSDEVFTPDTVQTPLSKKVTESNEKIQRPNAVDIKPLRTSESNEDSSDKTKYNKANVSDATPTTSTPRVNRRIKTDLSCEAGSTQNINRPVPAPRKRNSAIGLIGLSSFDDAILQVNNDKSDRQLDIHRHCESSETTIDLKTENASGLSKSSSCSEKSPPVPKQRRNLSNNSQSTFSVSSQPSSPSTSSPSVPKQPTLAALTASTSSLLKPSVNPKNSEYHNGKSSISQLQNKNIPISSHQHYTKDSSKSSSKHHQTPENPSTKSKLSPVSILKQTKHQTPEHTQKHCPENIDPCSTNLHSKSSSLCDLSRDTSRGCSKNGARFDESDIYGVADDEMSPDEECPDVEKNYSGICGKRGSLRKCVSVDDLLTSGSILDRSMILARKRRRRMRERKYKSQMLGSAEADEDCDAVKDRKDFIQYAYQFHKERSEERKKRSKKGERKRKGLNQTDSGHDSDSLSLISASPPIAASVSKSLALDFGLNNNNDSTVKPSLSRDHQIPVGENKKVMNGSVECNRGRFKDIKKSFEDKSLSNQLIRKTKSCEGVNKFSSTQIKSKSSVETIV